MMMSDSQRTMMRTKGVVIGRIFIGLLFLVSGIGTATNTAGMIPLLESIGLPLPELLIWVVVALKVIGGGMIVAGFRVGLAASALIAFTFLTIVLVHNDLSDQNHFIAALKNIAIIGGLIYVIAFGAGKWNK